MRTLSLTTAARPRQIISTTLRDSTPELSAIIPDTPTLNANIQHLRKRAAFPYIFPTNAIEFVVPCEYKNTCHEEGFLFSDTFVPSEGQILLYDRWSKDHSSTKQKYLFRNKIQYSAGYIFSTIHNPCPNLKSHRS
ncbi:hypothetical protein RF11_02106 [Thelohanellus kitauei]|uniref:Uncharacterized protein n=1 Tax=Thelohanellus kitauei TaxID=669202 RepID=A0A0C2MF59_THEKT|nr:hypothetical protein RF11_02106 [Thelohanellus kitauei]